MSFTPHYHARNCKNLAQLGDKTKALAKKFYEYCIKNELDILVYETVRTVATQQANVNKGASQTMKSYHIVRQALDFAPCTADGEVLWNGYSDAKVKKAIAYAESIGFTWGGSWKTLVDKPHLQYDKIGYGKDTVNGLGIFNIDLNGITESTQVNVVDHSTPEIESRVPALPEGIFSEAKNGKTYSAQVKQIQEFLNSIYFKVGEADGYYGPKTTDAIERFQSVYIYGGKDGIYGPTTRDYMIKIYKKLH